MDNNDISLTESVVSSSMPAQFDESLSSTENALTESQEETLEVVAEFAVTDRPIQDVVDEISRALKELEEDTIDVVADVASFIIDSAVDKAEEREEIGVMSRSIIVDMIKDMRFEAPMTSAAFLKAERSEQSHLSPIISPPIKQGNKTLSQPEEYQAFIFSVAESVKKSLFKYYNQHEAPIGQFRIVSEEQFIELCRSFSRQFRQELKDSHVAFVGDTKGLSLTPDHRMYIQQQIDIKLENLQQERRARR